LLTTPHLQSFDAIRDAPENSIIVADTDLVPEMIGRGLMFALGLYFCLYAFRPRVRLVRTLPWWCSEATSDPVARACFGTMGSGLMIGAFLL
jgi:hypothetical protein